MKNGITPSPKVSVYISTCNRLDKLKRAILSVQNQDYHNIEILICDDASNDGTEAYINELMLSDNRVRYFRNNKNQGACATRNMGIFSASGLYITGLDDDDEFTSDRISCFLENWDSRYAFICCDFDNKYLDVSSRYYNDNSNSIFSYKDLLFDNPASNQIFTLTSKLKEIGGFDIRARRLQDWDTWLRLSYRFGEFLRLPFSTYIMHHDHAEGEKRVSKSYSFLDALNDMSDRNKSIYGDFNYKVMKYSIDYQNKSLTLRSSINWVLMDKNIKHFFKYFIQFFGKKNNTAI